MTLLESLSPLYIYLIIALDTMPMKKLTIEYKIKYWMHEMLKRKEKEPQSGNATMMLYQGKVGNSS